MNNQSDKANLQRVIDTNKIMDLIVRQLLQEIINEKKMKNEIIES